MKKRILALVLGAVMLASIAVAFTGCGTTANDGGLSRIQDQLLGEYTRDLAGTTLNVVNWGEFIATGPELHIVRAFETLTGINVNYSTFNTNDELHTRLTAGGESFDLAFPSDYMIQRLINEGNLNRINFDNIPNLEFIQRDVHGLDMLDLWFDPGGLYSVPYVWGMTGLIYNYNLVYEPPTSWTALWEERYAGQILMFESSRDSFAVAKFILGLDVNSENEEDWHAAAELLREQAPLVRQYVGDEIYGIMIGGDAALGPYYVGCFLLMRTLTDEDLRFVFPEEGVNFFVDSMIIPATSQNQRGAEMFINFLLEPAVARLNAEAVFYAFPHTEVVDYEGFSRRGDPILFPTNLPPYQRFVDQPREFISLRYSLWDEIRNIR
ncbi:MAG: spermidine/putrescine ABC transporter substrate-binding protein [Oscillospiraceae bacterium]|nr:spermidine/putrescine ABC transporter substrate-binding protein [Oscillospiraceae bacterium]